jgi:O-antigen/teichoic acid export membrane protein
MGKSNIRGMVSRAWNSPTIMTWASFLVRSLSLIIVLPLILIRFSTEEIALWYLFITIIGLQMFVDMGLSPTFSRVISYAMGGADVNDLKSPKNKNNGKTNWESIECISSEMRRIYSSISWFWTVLLSTAGTALLVIPISQVQDTALAWSAWAVILIVSTVVIKGNIFISYLQGINQIAIFRRWEAITSFGGIIASILVLVFDGNLLGMVIANQGFVLVSIYINRRLSRTLEDGHFKNFSIKGKNKKVFDAVWPSAWRSGIGVILTAGLMQLSGIMYAQFGSSAEIATYLLGLRLIITVSSFSQAPFYSKLPLLSRLYAEGKKDELIKISQRGMMLSHWVYVIGFIIIGVAGEKLLILIESNADFPSHLLWILLGIGFFAERYGAMHLQLYSITNHIIWHTVAVWTGLILLIVSVSLLPRYDYLSFAIAKIAAYFGFYSWYCARYSYRKFGMSFLQYESKTTLLPTLVLVVFGLWWLS